MNRQDYIEKIKGCRTQIGKYREKMEQNNSMIMMMSMAKCQKNISMQN